MTSPRLPTRLAEIRSGRLSVARRRLHRKVADVRNGRPQIRHESPWLDVDKWEASRLVLDLAKVVGTHPYPLDELMLMTAAFAFHRPTTVVEIGTHEGVSGRVWYELSQRLETDTEIHTIDVYDPSHSEFPGANLGRAFRGLPVKQHIGDGVEIAPTLIPPSGSTLLYLDGDHAYDTVRKELAAARDLSEGCILLHDTFPQAHDSSNPGPRVALEDALPELSVARVVHMELGPPGMSYIGLGPATADGQPVRR